MLAPPRSTLFSNGPISIWAQPDYVWLSSYLGNINLFSITLKAKVKSREKKPMQTKSNDFLKKKKKSNEFEPVDL